MKGRRSSLAAMFLVILIMGINRIKAETIFYPPKEGISRFFIGTTDERGRPIKGCYGYVNGAGEVIHECDIYYAEDFMFGLAIISKPDYSADDDLQFFSVQPKFSSAIIDADGGMYDGYYYIERCEDGSFLIAEKDDDTQEIKWGYLNSRGKPLTEVLWIWAEPFYENRAFVRSAQNGMWDVIDANGDIVKESTAYDAFSYEIDTRFSEGLAAVCLSETGDHWGYINHDCETVIDAVYDEAGHFKGGFAYVNRDAVSYIINKQGTIIMSDSDAISIRENLGNGSILIYYNGFYHVYNVETKSMDTNKWLTCICVKDENYVLFDTEHVAFMLTEEGYEKLPENVGKVVWSLRGNL